MYADFVLDIWIQVGIVVVTVVVTIMGLRRTLRRNRENTELRMYATVEAAKLRHNQGTHSFDEDSGSNPQNEKGEDASPDTEHES